MVLLQAEKIVTDNEKMMIKKLCFDILFIISALAFFVTRYYTLYMQKNLLNKMDAEPIMTEYYNSCNLCPRRCGVNRYTNRGYCGEGAELRLACASIHRGEEPPVTGSGGSGTIFVSGCNLCCVFCQNYQISQASVRDVKQSDSAKPAVSEEQGTAIGRVVTNAEFAGICLALEKHGAENINIVTGSHVIPAIAAGIDAARGSGLQIPVLWNTSSYENPETLELLRGRVSVFLPDLKTLDSNIAENFFNAPDYPEAASKAILKMLDLANSNGIEGNQTYDKNKLIVRHLILPGFLDSTKQVLKWFADNLSGKALLSLMTQYTPPAESCNSLSLNAARKNPAKLKKPLNYVSESDYLTVIGWLDEFGIDDGFCQELVTGSDWLPDFNRINPFSSELSKPVWHWNCGFVDKLA